jgi:acetyl-CoA carboxylase biotin carboxyl carrier protein
MLPTQTKINLSRGQGASRVLPGKFATRFPLRTTTNRGHPSTKARADKRLNGGSTTAVDLDLEEFNDVLRIVHDTDIVELSLKTNNFQISVRKKEALEAEQQMQNGGMYMQQPPVAYAPPPSAPVAAAPAPATTVGEVVPAPSAPASTPEASSAGSDAPAGNAITSPMSGTFYRSPAPGEPAFVKQGDTVTKGQKVCIIEAMKLMNEIEAEISGTIVEILLKDGNPVTPGQPLMIIS